MQESACKQPLMDSLTAERNSRVEISKALGRRTNGKLHFLICPHGSIHDRIIYAVEYRKFSAAK